MMTGIRADTAGALPSASIDVESGNLTSIVRVAGDLDIETAPRLRQVTADLLTGGPTELVLDLRLVKVLDSSAMGVLVGAFKRARSADCLLTLGVRRLWRT